MSETTSLKLPLLQPSQAQKHVTVNEALVRLDGLAQITLQSRQTSTPPAVPSDGACYAVPGGAMLEWSGRDGMLAIASNGGWVFVPPMDGWSCWVVDEHVGATFLQGDWRAGVIGCAPNGAGSRFVVAEAEHEIVAGTEQFIDLPIPANSMVFACSARVAEAVSGTLTSWEMDIAGQSITFGSGMGLGVGSYCTGLLSSPTTLYSADQPRIAPVGGDFAGGRLLLAAHYYRIDLPG